MKALKKCDMHVHSSASKEMLVSYTRGESHFWYQRLAGRIESIAQKITGETIEPSWKVYFRLGPKPARLYQDSLVRGMDYFCLTDHDSIDGWKQLLDEFPDLESKVIRGAEITTKIPGKSEVAHVNAYEISETQFKEAEELAPNIYDLADYLKQNKIFASINHPCASVGAWKSNHKDSNPLEDLLQLAILFPALEVRNGVFSSYEQESKTTELANRLGKSKLCGSDSHIGDVGATWVEAYADNKAEFLDSIRIGDSIINGRCGGREVLAREFVGLSRTYEGLYFTDGNRFIDKRLDFWEKGLARGVIFNLIESLVRLGIYVFSKQIAKWAETRIT